MARIPELPLVAPLLLSLAALLCACAGAPAPAQPGSAAPGSAAPAAVDDPHSYARPQEVAVEHLGLDLTVDFPRKQLAGRASLRLRNRAGATAAPPRHPRPRRPPRHPRRRQPRRASPWASRSPSSAATLIVEIAPDTHVGQHRLRHQPRRGGRAVAGAAADRGRAPVPLHPVAGDPRPHLGALPGHAERAHDLRGDDARAARADGGDERREPDGEDAPTASTASACRSPSPPTSWRSRSATSPSGPSATARGVYAEPAVVERAAWELADTPKMIAAAEKLYGPYRWGRYDLLVLPPSFPFGGMENPRLTFATPTILAGDRSLVSLVAHELAHSWSGQPGDQRHLERLLAQRGVHHLLREPDHGGGLRPPVRRDARGPRPRRAARHDRGAGARQPRHPAQARPRRPRPGRRDHRHRLREGATSCCGGSRRPSGARSLRQLPAPYFEHHAFQSMDHGAASLALLDRELLAEHPELRAEVQIQPGSTARACRRTRRSRARTPSPRSRRRPAAFAAGTAAAAAPDRRAGPPTQWLHFLRSSAEPLAGRQMADLDADLPASPTAATPRSSPPGW